PRPYRDYITWLQQQDLARAEAFWRHTLAGVTPTLLGFDRPPAAGPQQYATETVELDAAPTQALQAFARAQHLTLTTLIQGAWALLLQYSSDADEVVFGITVAAGPAELPQVERLVGLVIITLPLPVRLAPDLPLQ